MSFLRRRHGRAATPVDESEGTADNEDYRLVSRKHLDSLKKSPRSSKRRNAWIFTLGGIFGLVVAAFFANNSDLIDLASLGDINFDGLLDVLPAGLINDAKEFQVRQVSVYIFVEI
jgi:phospholipid:diacylglycerol acyltransferase